MDKIKRHANQHNNLGLVSILEERYGRSIQDIFYNFIAKGYTLETLSEETGFAATTIRKHAKCYNIRIPTNHMNQKMVSTDRAISIWLKRLNEDKINRINILSRRWVFASRFSAMLATSDHFKPPFFTC